VAPPTTRRFYLMTNRNVIVCRDIQELSQKAAAEFIRLAQEAVGRTGRFTVALSGGSTPLALYSLLASPGYCERIPWSQVHLYFGDERCVPPQHADSNFHMVQETLLAKIILPRENCYRIAGELDPAVAAADYEQQLRKLFGVPAGGVPRFDLMLLGLGVEGHTASLFPGSDALTDQQHLVVATFVEKLQAHRVTLTLPVINHAAQVLFLVAGKDKAPVVEQIVGTLPEAAELPAARVQPIDGGLIWLITQDAASEMLQ
jgi:6-phosphogluconolactonase